MLRKKGDCARRAKFASRIFDDDLHDLNCGDRILNAQKKEKSRRMQRIGGLGGRMRQA